MNCPWYISATAARDYLRIRGWPDDDASFNRAEEELIEIAIEIVASGKEGKLTEGGYLRYRTGRARGRIGLVVSTTPRPEGDLPQLIAVTRSGVDR